MDLDRSPGLSGHGRRFSCTPQSLTWTVVLPSPVALPQQSQTQRWTQTLSSGTYTRSRSSLSAIITAIEIVNGDLEGIQADPGGPQGQVYLRGLDCRPGPNRPPSRPFSALKGPWAPPSARWPLRLQSPSQSRHWPLKIADSGLDRVPNFSDLGFLTWVGAREQRIPTFCERPTYHHISL